MKKQLIVFCLFVTVSAASAQKENVAGTRISIIPPQGFTKGQNFTGYQKGETAMINVMDLWGGNFYSNAASFTKENFESKGITVDEFKEMTIDGFPAKYVKMRADPINISVNLVFGDSTFSAMIMGVYPASDADLDKEIEKSIFSASYAKELTVDPFANAFFSLDDSDTQLKYAQSSANMYMYSVDGQSKSSAGQPLMMVLPLPYDNMSSPKQTAESMISGLRDKGLTEVEYISSSDERINGYEAYELIAKGKMEGEEAYLLVQTIIKGANQLIIQGLQKGGSFDPDIFRKLTNTVKMK